MDINIKDVHQEAIILQWTLWMFFKTWRYISPKKKIWKRQLNIWSKINKLFTHSCFIFQALNIKKWLMKKNYHFSYNFNIIQIDIFCAHINYKQKVTPAKGMNVPKYQLKYFYKLHEPFFYKLLLLLSFVYCCHIYKAFLTKK